jgi:very-short-patch-repair endonuclease
VLSGYSAAVLLTADCAPADAPAEIILPRSHRCAPAGLVIRQDLLADDEWRTSRNTDLTTPVRTAYDLARRCPLVEAVVALDAVAGRFGFAPSEVLVMAERHPRARGTVRLPRVVGLSQPRAESAMETRLRMVLVLGGLPRPTVQHPVRDEHGRLLATVDMAYPDQMLAIEYEGADHFTARRGTRDAYRYTRLVDMGWRVYRYTARDVYENSERIVSEIDRALRRCAAPT